MSSSLERVVSLLRSWKSESRPARLFAPDSLELNKIELVGFVHRVSQNGMVFAARWDGLPCRLFVPFRSALAFEVVEFEDAVARTFGVPFENLSPEERGRVWAKRFELAVIVRFAAAECKVYALAAI